MTGPEFEDMVRNTARALWNVPYGSGASIIVDGRERDCIFYEENLVHYIEVTKDRKLEKVKKDATKLIKFRDKHVKKGIPVKLWIVTEMEPTADQNTHCKKNGITILSFKEFRRIIIDAPRYVELRRNYRFGSATDPKNNSSDLSEIQYQQVAIHLKSDSTKIEIKDIGQMLLDGKQILLLGDYGTGKSINIRQLFFELIDKKHPSSDNIPIPVILNLREHWGQESPTEALIRHATNIGFSNPDQLVRAFNAGRLTIILDGFDEVGSTPWIKVSSTALREIRKEATILINNFVVQSKGKCSILVAGREHFFDSIDEIFRSFGLGQDCAVIELQEFSDGEATDFLKKNGYNKDLPSWFPKRPLLLASLAANKLIDAVLEASEKYEPVKAWDTLIDLICEREAQIHSNLDSNGIRRILEKLSSYARSSTDNIGPINEDHIAEAFRYYVGAYPDQSARALLHRLPGLSLRDNQVGTRYFMDDQLMDVLRAGCLHQFILSPYSDPEAKSWKHGIGILGAQIVAEKLSCQKNKESHLSLGIKEAMDRWFSPTLAMDIVLIYQQISERNNFFNCNGITLNEGYCDTLDLSNYPSPENLTISNFIINELVLPFEPIKNLIIESCLIQRIIGAANEEGLPKWINFCEIMQYDETMSNARILAESSQPQPVKVLLTILRKLYLQKGSGRKENALTRGLDPKSSSFVNPILEILFKEGFCFSVKKRGNTIWHNVSGKKNRAISIIESSGHSTDTLISAVRDIE